MTRSRYRFHEEGYPYFLTCTIVGWLAVFTRPDTVQILYDSWRYLMKEKEFRLFGYVILEHHLHFVASAPDLASVVKSFKMYTARQIINVLEANHVEVYLKHLRAMKSRYKVDSEYQVWQEGSHPQQISGPPMMIQKIEYMHNNPVERGYVDEAVHWRYSSARNYGGLPGLIEVITDWQ
jgi:putative transposase